VLPINRATPALDQTECIAHARITGLLLKRIILRSIPASFLELKPGIVTIGLLNGPLTITTTITQFAISFAVSAHHGKIPCPAQIGIGFAWLPAM
jgi:hypothetical protein